MSNFEGKCTQRIQKKFSLGKFSTGYFRSFRENKINDFDFISPF